MDVVGSLGFSCTGIEVASTVLARATGLMGRDPIPLLIPTSSVHGFGLRSQVWAAGIGHDGVVIGVRPIKGRLAWFRGARWVLELPPSHPRPAAGERLTFARLESEPEDDAGTSIPVRNPDRQSR